MADSIAIVSDMGADTFQEVISASPRKIRETLFGRLGIKAKKKTVGLRVHGRLEERTKKLHARLKDASSDAERELCEELVRNWLFTKRDLLAATLDYLGVENDGGLIEEEPTFFKELEKEKVQALVAHLVEQGFEMEPILIYLKFHDVPFLEEAKAA